MSNPTAPVKKYEKNPDERGAAWIKQGNAGQYISLSLDITPDMVGTRIPFVMFLKKTKTSDNQPDYTVLISKRNNTSGVTQPKTEKVAAAAKVQKTAAPAVESSDLDF